MMHHRLCMLTMLLAGTAGAETFCGTGPANIPDGTGGSCSWTLQIDTPAPELITSVRVLMTVDHPWVGDLSCTLFAPDGTSVRLIDRVGMPDSTWIGPWGCGGDDILCLFDDAGSTAAETACALDVTPVLSGNLQPLDSLSAFQNRNPEGTWTAIFTDHSFIDAGTISQLCLVVESDSDCDDNGLPDAVDIADGISEDTDGDGIPDECQCSADIDGNGQVDVSDLLTVIANWNCSTGCDGDIDGSGMIDVTDLLAIISSWGDCN